jgi:hypothetical protein
MTSSLQGLRKFRAKENKSNANIEGNNNGQSLKYSLQELRKHRAQTASTSNCDRTKEDSFKDILQDRNLIASANFHFGLIVYYLITSAYFHFGLIVYYLITFAYFHHFGLIVYYLITSAYFHFGLVVYYLITSAYFHFGLVVYYLITSAYFHFGLVVYYLIL